MKKSKIFLAITTTFLGVAAVAATKANHKTALTQYYVTNGAAVCNFRNQAPPQGCSLANGQICTDGTTHRIFTQINLANHCTHQIFKPL